MESVVDLTPNMYLIALGRPLHVLQL